MVVYISQDHFLGLVMDKLDLLADESQYLIKDAFTLFEPKASREEEIEILKLKMILRDHFSHRGKSLIVKHLHLRGIIVAELDEDVVKEGKDRCGVKMGEEFDEFDMKAKGLVRIFLDDKAEDA